MIYFLKRFFMDVSILTLGINVGLLATGIGIGYKIGYSNGSSKTVTKMTQPCKTLFEHNKSTWREPTVYYHGTKAFTNTCPELQGKKCSYTAKKCYLL